MTQAVARQLFKLMAYKDEYEVARLLVDPAFERQMAETFDKPKSFAYRLHPPLLRRFGVNKKIRLGAWSRPILKLLAACKGLRGTAFDPFGRMPARKLERELIGWYRDLLDRLLVDLTAANRAHAIAIARAPEDIRGYEEVKEASAKKVRERVEAEFSVLFERPAA